MTQFSRNSHKDNGRIVAENTQEHALNTEQLHILEQSFRKWLASTNRENVRLSRLTATLIFLIIRYTGAKLSEVLHLTPETAIDFEQCSIFFQSKNAMEEGRSVPIPEQICAEIAESIATLKTQKGNAPIFYLDAGFVRRKFYECAEACGLPKELSGPEAIRRARAIELMQSDIPLPVVQNMLGHATLNLTTAHVAFSSEEMQAVAKRFVQKELSQKTSARNCFIGKIISIASEAIQSLVTLQLVEGTRIKALITNDSVQRLALAINTMVCAEVKAPLVMLYSGEQAPLCSAENILSGTLTYVKQGDVMAEYILQLADNTEVCILSTTILINIPLGTSLWAAFNASSVVLRVD